MVTCIDTGLKLLLKTGPQRTKEKVTSTESVRVQVQQSRLFWSSYMVTCIDTGLKLLLKTGPQRTKKKGQVLNLFVFKFNTAGVYTLAYKQDHAVQ